VAITVVALWTQPCAVPRRRRRSCESRLAAAAQPVARRRFVLSLAPEGSSKPIRSQASSRARCMRRSWGNSEST
jgi:hypothetical protein